MKIDVFNSLCPEAQEEFLKVALSPVAPFAGAQRITGTVGKVLGPAHAAADAAKSAVTGVGKVVAPQAATKVTTGVGRVAPPTGYTPLFPRVTPDPTFQPLPTINQGLLELSKKQLTKTPTHHLLNDASPKSFMRAMQASQQYGIEPGIAHNLLNMHDAAIARGAKQVVSPAPAAPLRKIVLPPPPV